MASNRWHGGVIVCFALLSTCVLAIVWPQADLHFDIDPHAILDAHLAAEELALAGLTLELIAHMRWRWKANSRRLVRVVRVFRIGACLLAMQIVLTIVAASAIV